MEIMTLSDLDYRQVRRRNKVSKFVILLASAVLPVLTWVSAKGLFHLSGLQASWATLVALALSGVLLKFARSNFEKNNARSYLGGDEWIKLSEMFGVSEMPESASNQYATVGFIGLGVEDVYFTADIQVTGKGIYVNAHELGRVSIPWPRIGALDKSSIQIKRSHFAIAAVSSPHNEYLMTLSKGE